MVHAGVVAVHEALACIVGVHDRVGVWSWHEGINSVCLSAFSQRYAKRHEFGSKPFSIEVMLLH
jgi:hypothetical protein